MEQKPSHNNPLTKELEKLDVSEHKSVTEVKRIEKKLDILTLILISFAILIIVNVIFLMLVNSDLSVIKSDLNLINSSLQNISKNVGALQTQGNLELYLSLIAIILSIIYSFTINENSNLIKNKKKHEHKN